MIVRIPSNPAVIREVERLSREAEDLFQGLPPREALEVWLFLIYLTALKVRRANELAAQHIKRNWPGQ